MDMKRTRALAGAIVLATSFAGFSGSAAAEDAALAAAESAREQHNAAQDAEEIQRVQNDAADQTASVAAAAVEKKAEEDARDARVQEWEKTRPDDKKLDEDTKIAEGKTIVDIVITGAGSDTMATAREAVTQRAGDVYDAKKAADDRSAIYDTGYFYDLYPSWEYVPEGVVLTYHVLENPVLRSIKIEGNTVEKTEELEKLITVKTGRVLNGRELQKNVSALQEKYRADGYILAKIEDMNIDTNGDLKLKINEGKLAGYAVKGNTKTKDYVITREMRQKPGEPFDVKLARRSMQRVYNLGFFQDVNMKLNPQEDGSVILETDVVEKRTGNFGIGAGYSSSDGFIGMINVGDSNFLGMGDAINVLYEMSGKDTDARGFSFSYTRPWLDKKETSGTIRVYNRTSQYDDYNTDGNLIEKYMRKYSGGELTLGRPASEYSTNYITLRNRKDEYERHKGSGLIADRSTPAYEAWRKANFGTTRSITLSHVTDTRDNIYNPTSGAVVNLVTEFAGFGGDFKYQKYTLEDKNFFKVGRAHTVAFRGQYGYGHGNIPESNQYKVGGQDSLRGYRDDQFRGDHMFLTTLEYRFPLVKKMQGAVFTDWGAAWASGFWPENIKGSVGLGLQFDTPVGPLRLDYGRGKDGGRVHFSVGGSF